MGLSRFTFVQPALAIALLSLCATTALEAQAAASRPITVRRRADPIPYG
ncbi:MAG: hypothetical protein ABI681_05615 [Gemmatimonadales bacterium]